MRIHIAYRRVADACHPPASWHVLRTWDPCANSWTHGENMKEAVGSPPSRVALPSGARGARADFTSLMRADDSRATTANGTIGIAD